LTVEGVGLIFLKNVNIFEWSLIMRFQIYYEFISAQSNFCDWYVFIHLNRVSCSPYII